MFGFQKQRIGKLEAALGAAIVALVFQLLAANEESWGLFVRIVDVRNWPWPVRVGANFVLVATLVTIRFLPDLKTRLRERRARGTTRSRTNPSADGPIVDADYEARRKRDAEWRDRAKKRRPHL